MGVKKRAGFKKKADSFLSMKVSNRLSYTIIAAFVLIAAAVVVYAAAPNPGHSGSELDLSDGVSGNFIFSTPGSKNVIGGSAIKGSYGSGTVLEVQGSGTSILSVGASTGSLPIISSDDFGYNGLVSNTHPLKFIVGGERMVITQTGNVGIGVADPTKRLHIDAGVSPGTPGIKLDNAGAFGGPTETIGIAGYLPVSVDTFTYYIPLYHIVPPPPAPQTPTAPSSLSADAVSSIQINLQWIDNSNNEGWFELERSGTSSSSGFTLLETHPSNTNFVSDNTANPSTQYWYRVRACHSSTNPICSSYSNIATATTQGGPA